MNRLVAAGVAGAAGLTVAATGYAGVVTGRLTVDLGVGRRVRPLGPISVSVDAPRQRVFDAAAAPYAVRQAQAWREKVRILDRAGPMLVAAHRTPVGGRLTAVTVEAVVLEPPEQMRFRLLRGPVPQVEETFEFVEDAGATILTYSGVLGTDLWGLGARWGDLVARSWENTVRSSLERLRQQVERR